VLLVRGGKSFSDSGAGDEVKNMRGDYEIVEFCDFSVNLKKEDSERVVEY